MLDLQGDCYEEIKKGCKRLQGTTYSHCSNSESTSIRRSRGQIQ
jgi:hypothetical protein